MVFSLTNINSAEGIGTSFLNILKGSAQVGAGILDKTLDTSFGALDLGALVIVLSLAVMVLVKLKEGAHHIQSAI